MNKLKLLLSSFLVVTVSFTTLQGQQTLSLQECIDIAVEQNYSLRITQNQEKITTNNYSRGNAGMLPLVNLSSGFSGNINNLNQELTDGSEVNPRNIHNTTGNAGVNLSWSLFEGFRAQVRYKQLQELMKMSELNTRISIENLIANLASEYYFYIQQQRQLDNLQYSVDLSKERVRIEREHFLLGSGSRVQLLQAQVNLNADSSRLERQYEVLNASRVRINEMMALSDLNRDFEPADTVIDIDKGMLYDELHTHVLTQNTAIATALKNRQLSEYDMQIIQSRSFPYLRLSSGYGFTHNTYQRGTLNNQQTWGMNYGISLGINLYDGRNRQREKNNARIELENSELNLKQIRQQAKGDLLTLFDAYNNNLRLLELETQNLEVARENLEIAFERYRLGALTGFELREVQKNLLEAEERLLSIQYQAKVAEISLLQISGRILELL